MAKCGLEIQTPCNVKWWHLGATIFISADARLRQVVVVEADGSRSLVNPVNLMGLPKYRYSVLLQVTKHAG